MDDSQDHNIEAEDSYNGPSEGNQKAFEGDSSEARRVSRARKAKEARGAKDKSSRNRKRLKRGHEEYSQMDVKSGVEAIRDLTRYRSLKIAKERDDIVDPRNLAPKVLQF